MKGVGPAHRCTKKQANKWTMHSPAAVSVCLPMSSESLQVRLEQRQLSLIPDSSDTVHITSELKCLFLNVILFLASSAALDI